MGIKRPSDGLTREERQARVAEALKQIGSAVAAERYMKGAEKRKLIQEAAEAKPYTGEEEGDQ